MNIQATKLELIKMITEIQSEKLLGNIKDFISQAEKKQIKSLSKRESDLLLAINEGIPEEMHTRLLALQTKQKKHSLSLNEQQELHSLIDAVEELDGRRLENMLSLSKLWDISLDQLRLRLDIKAPDPHVW
ncbi:MAG: hypothetical protein R2828_08025 [Saprospiraceae bacterium]